MMRLFGVTMLCLYLAGCRSGDPPNVAARERDASPAARPGEVVLNPVKQQKAGIVVAPVTERKVNEAIQAPGQITVDEDRTWSVGAIAGGRIAEVLVKLGDRVAKGQVIARVHSEEVHEVRAAYRRAQEELRRAQEAREQAVRTRDRARRLFDLKAASREQVETAETEHRNAQAAVQNARTELEKERIHLTEFFDLPAEEEAGGRHDPRLDYIPVRSPAAGMVTERKATTGSVVAQGENLFTVTDPAFVWMIAAVDEADLSHVRPGQSVRVSVRAWPDQRFNGRVLRLGEQLDAATRTLQVRISVPNQGLRLKPEMYATAEIVRPAQQDAVFVPEDALQEVNGHQVVFVSTGRGRFEARPVDLGARESGQVLVRAGVSPGDQIVVRGGFILKSQMLARTLSED